MEPEQYCLKWNNFQSNLSNAFGSLLGTEDLADVTLTCEGISIKAHKLVLSLCSPYFRNVFKVSIFYKWLETNCTLQFIELHPNDLINLSHFRIILVHIL